MYTSVPDRQTDRLTGGRRDGLTFRRMVNFTVLAYTPFGDGRSRGNNVKQH